MLASLTRDVFGPNEMGTLRDVVGAGVVEAVWARDLPVVPAGDEDNGQGDDPFAYLARAAATMPEALPLTMGTASVILGIRHPLVVARAAVGAQVAFRGRFVLGLGSGGKAAMNAALDVEDRSAHLFSERWRAVRRALRGEIDSGLDFAVPSEWAPPPVYLASARASHWEAVDGDADGWMAFLTGWEEFERTYRHVSSAHGSPTPVALRIDLELLGYEVVSNTPHRGRLRCSRGQLADVFRRIDDGPVEHVLLRLVSDEPVDDLRRAREVWDAVP